MCILNYCRKLTDTLPVHLWNYTTFYIIVLLSLQSEYFSVIRSCYLLLYVYLLPILWSILEILEYDK